MISEEIQKEIEEVFKLPAMKRVERWQKVIEKYGLPIKTPFWDQMEEDQIKKELGFKYTIEDHLNLMSKIDQEYPTDNRVGINFDETMELGYQLGLSILTENTVKNCPEAIMKFMELNAGYLNHEDYNSITNSILYKDAKSKVIFDRVKKGETMPDADPYFRIDPEDELAVVLFRGVNRGFYTAENLEQALDSQNTKSETFKRLREINNELYKRDHLPFGQERKDTKDYGFHLFLGRKTFHNDETNSEDYYYVCLDKGTTMGLGEDLDNVVSRLWGAVRKKRKVLMNKSPKAGYEPLFPNEMIELYDEYWAVPARKEFEDPFKYQPSER